MKPEMVYPMDESKYVYAYCQCPLDIRYAIKIRRKPGVIEYPFKCDVCGTEGKVISNGGII